MASEIEGASEPNPRRDEEGCAAGVMEVLDAKDCFFEGVGVEFAAVADAAEVGDGDGFGSRLHRHDGGACGLVGGGCWVLEVEEEEEER